MQSVLDFNKKLDAVANDLNSTEVPDLPNREVPKAKAKVKADATKQAQPQTSTQSQQVNQQTADAKDPKAATTQQASAGDGADVSQLGTTTADGKVIIAKTVDIPPWPKNKLELPLFHAKTANNLAAAGRHHDKSEVGWYLEVKTKSYDELASAGNLPRMAILDNLVG